VCTAAISTAASKVLIMKPSAPASIARRKSRRSGREAQTMAAVSLSCGWARRRLRNSMPLPLENSGEMKISAGAPRRRGLPSHR
jgi:hypothetical protein